MDYLFVGCGLLSIGIGLFAKNFYAGDAIAIAGYKRERVVSKWWGRLVFIVVGILLLFVGFTGTNEEPF